MHERREQSDRDIAAAPDDELSIPQYSFGIQFKAIATISNDKDDVHHDSIVAHTQIENND
jgi:hypothetical protein